MVLLKLPPRSRNTILIGMLRESAESSLSGLTHIARSPRLLVDSLRLEHKRMTIQVVEGEMRRPEFVHSGRDTLTTPEAVVVEDDDTTGDQARPYPHEDVLRRLVRVDVDVAELDSSPVHPRPRRLREHTFQDRELRHVHLGQQAPNDLL